MFLCTKFVMHGLLICPLWFAIHAYVTTASCYGDTSVNRLKNDLQNFVTDFHTC
jgi:hypothetical protein